MSEPIHIISLGAGVQSSTMALMAAKGEITPMPVAAVFADTGDEPKVVYRWLRELESLIPFPVIRALHGEGRLSDNLVNKWDHSALPSYFMSGGEKGMGKRQCTNHFKLQPIRREARRVADGRPVVMWIGISIDEVSRAKDSGAKWLTHRFPLLDARMNRTDCVAWLKKEGVSNVPKSACVYCPYQRDSQFREHKKQAGDWDLILKVDKILNARGEFLHRSCKPIADVDFSTEEERGQINMFNNDCEGMCGV
jgi:hypothetical protein